MTAARMAATRHLLGLSQAELAAELGVTRHAVKDWESGRFSPRRGVVDDLAVLRARHDRETARLAAGAAAGVISIPEGPRPRGWYLALAARVIDRMPDAMLDWPAAGSVASCPDAAAGPPRRFPLESEAPRRAGDSLDDL